MPIYEYGCDKCGEVFEVTQRISDDPLTTHAGCGGEVRRLISNTSFVLKGSGWYKTDYAAPKKAPDKGGDGAASGDAAAKSGGDNSAAGGKTSTPKPESSSAAAS